MAEIILKDNKSMPAKDLVSLNQIIERLLPKADTKVKNKLRIKVYSLSRTRKWPWKTIKKRRYYKPEIAQSITATVKDYADQLKNGVIETEKSTSQVESKKVSLKAATIKISKIIKKATQNDNLSKKTKNKLKKRISYIAKINSMQPLKKGKAYEIEDGKQIILELATYYQQLKADVQLAEEVKQTQNDHHSPSLQREKSSKNNYAPYSEKKISESEKRYNNLLQKYVDLQLKYAQVLSEKNNLLNEKANQIFDQSRDLKVILNTILNKM